MKKNSKNLKGNFGTPQNSPMPSRKKEDEKEDDQCQSKDLKGMGEVEMLNKLIGTIRRKQRGSKEEEELYYNTLQKIMAERDHQMNSMMEEIRCLSDRRKSCEDREIQTDATREEEKRMEENSTGKIECEVQTISTFDEELEKFQVAVCSENENYAQTELSKNRGKYAKLKLKLDNKEVQLLESRGIQESYNKELERLKMVIEMKDIQIDGFRREKESLEKEVDNLIFVFPCDNFKIRIYVVFLLF